jgi:acetyl-CoA decarbonylase/synthase complex subunit gamma
MNYRVDPGLYALGEPDSDSPVLVTANYKMSFDRLRGALAGRSAWILVLDTKGVNVWCSAGKGTFGTQELIQRVRVARLSEVVRHRRLVLPQLSGPGVTAREVTEATGFHVLWGPVRARDLPRYLDSGLKAAPEMRVVSFGWRERAVLIPVELAGALKKGVPLTMLLILGGALGWSGAYWDNVVSHGALAATALGLAILAGAVVAPLLLPWLPGRAFAAKGIFAGCAASVALFWLFRWGSSSPAGLLELLGCCVIIVGAAAFLAMNFTGASTFTSLSGVRREMRWAVPVEIALVTVGLSAWIAARFVT